MFDRIKSFFRELRIDLDFPRYERQERDGSKEVEDLYQRVKREGTLVVGGES